MINNSHFIVEFPRKDAFSVSEEVDEPTLVPRGSEPAKLQVFLCKNEGRKLHKTHPIKTA